MLTLDIFVCDIDMQGGFAMSDARHFNPYIIYVNHGSIQPGQKMFERMCLWYELDLIIESDEGSGVFTLDEFVPARPGTLFLRRPGDLVRGVGRFSFATILFDVIYDPELAPWYAAKRASLMSDVDVPFLRKYHANENRSFDFIERIPRVMHINEYDHLLRPMLEIANLEKKEDRNFQFYAKALLMNLLAEISRENDVGDLFVGFPPPVAQARDYIKKNYMHPITLESMAAHVSLNREYFCRLFKQHTRLTPMSYLQQQRIYHAKLLLLSEELSVEEIAGRCGFRDLSYFYAVFKKHTGLSPRQYKTQRPYGRITGGLTEE